MSRVVSLRFHGVVSEDSRLFADVFVNWEIITDVSEEISASKIRFCPFKIRLPNVSESSATSIKLHCTTLQKTWQGMDYFIFDYFPSFMTIEQFIPVLEMCDCQI
jgi:hypothetical protein